MQHMDGTTGGSSGSTIVDREDEATSSVSHDPHHGEASSAVHLHREYALSRMVVPPGHLQAMDDVDGAGGVEPSELEFSSPIYVSNDNERLVVGGRGGGGDGDDSSRGSGERQRRTPRNNIAMIVPRGHKLRDEFVCPITRELITEPVIAADGHTYDRSAIERWLHSHSTSPKTGEPLEHLHLVPNHNLKRLLRDMLREGGQALYCIDSDTNVVAPEGVGPAGEGGDGAAPVDGAGSRVHGGVPQLALVREQVLTCRCLGPVESDWIGRSFRVTEGGAVGGRRRPNELNGGERREFVQFTDATVSRKHFEIVFDAERQIFCLRDLGSAGGTFIRIPPGSPCPINPGMMIMLGKHQLVALESPAAAACVPPYATYPVPPTERYLRDAEQQCGASRRSTKVDDESLPTALASFTRDEDGPVVGGGATVNGYEYCRSKTVSPQWEQQQLMLEEAAATTDINTPKYGDIIASGGVRKRYYGDEVDGENTRNQGDGTRRPDSDEVPQGAFEDEKEDMAAIHSSRENFASPPVIEECEASESEGSESEAEFRRTQALEQHGVDMAVSCGPIMQHRHSHNQVGDEEQRYPQDPPLLVLRCFAPEGTPIQGHEFPIRKGGATLGRKAGNSISFSHRVENTCVGIDSSISGEHATVAYNDETGMLELNDGVIGKGKGSTNGTWVRLSGMHEESNLHPLADKTEILIGTVRFLVSIDEVVVERDIYE